MFSPNLLLNSSGRAFVGTVVDENDAFRRESAASTAGIEQNTADDDNKDKEVEDDSKEDDDDAMMNSSSSSSSSRRQPTPAKRGKYSMAVADDDDDAEEAAELLQLQQQMWQPGSSNASRDKFEQGSSNKLKQCEYVSNRTRLRCANMRRGEQMKGYGFCEEHMGYIERIRQDGLRTKHAFDPQFNIDPSFMEMISSDQDETLDVTDAADFPFVYESLYCDSRFDNEENPLRRARVYTQKELLREYSRSLARWKEALHEQRTIFKEKHQRVMQQIARLRDQPGQTLLDPVKDAEKLARLLAMRREAMRRDTELVMRKKFARMADKSRLEAAREQREKWLKQLDQPVDEDDRDVQITLDNMVELVTESRSKRGRPSQHRALTVANMHALARRRFTDSSRPLPHTALPQPLVDVLATLREAAERKRRDDVEAKQLKRKAAQQAMVQQLNQHYPLDGPSTSMAMSSLGKQPVYRQQVMLDSWERQPTAQKLAVGRPKQKQQQLNNLNTVDLGYRPNNVAASVLFPPPAGSSSIGSAYSSGTATFLAPSTPVFLRPSTSNTSTSMASMGMQKQGVGMLGQLGMGQQHMQNNGAVSNTSASRKNSIIRPIAIDEDVNPELFLQLTHPELLLLDDDPVDGTITHNNSGKLVSVAGRKRKSSGEQHVNNKLAGVDGAMAACARLRPWDGTRKTVTLVQQPDSQLEMNHMNMTPPQLQNQQDISFDSNSSSLNSLNKSSSSVVMLNDSPISVKRMNNLNMSMISTSSRGNSSGIVGAIEDDHQYYNLPVQQQQKQQPMPLLPAVPTMPGRVIRPLVPAGAGLMKQLKLPGVGGGAGSSSTSSGGGGGGSSYQQYLQQRHILAREKSGPVGNKAQKK